MTGDVRDRILALLSAGPASVARLAAGLGVPGGVVNYELKLLERDGLVRVGTTRREHGVPTPLYVSTAAAASPALPVPLPLPGLTWLADQPYPTPLWTVPAGAGPDREAASLAAAPDREPDPLAAAPEREPDPLAAAPDREPASVEEPAANHAAEDIPPHTGIRFPTRPRRTEPADDHAATSQARPAASRARPGEARARTAAEPREGRPHGLSESDALHESRRPGSPFRMPPPLRRFTAESARGPRLDDMRRVPMDDATFYEFAERLNALAREFAARATPGAPAAELTLHLTRPNGDSNTGYGS